MAVLPAGTAGEGGLTTAAELAAAGDGTDGRACCVTAVEGAASFGGIALAGMTVGAATGVAGCGTSDGLTGWTASFGTGVETIEEVFCAGGASGRAGGVIFARTTGFC